jgi:hypothetical protein
VGTARQRLRTLAAAQLRHEVRPVRRWLERQRLRGTTLVVFSSRARELMTTLVLTTPINDCVTLGASADLGPAYRALKRGKFDL